MSLEEKRELARRLLKERAARTEAPPAQDTGGRSTGDRSTGDRSTGGRPTGGRPTGRRPAPQEALAFYERVEGLKAQGAYTFEAPRAQAQRSEVEVARSKDELLRMINMSSYNYFGYGYHPDVIHAAKEALDTYGLGAASSPVISGTLAIHSELERRLVEFYGLDDTGVSLFSSGYGVNTGTMSAFLSQGHYAVLDQSAHMSIQEGAFLSRAHIRYFRHNDPENLDRILAGIRKDEPEARILVCAEGVYSHSGEYGALREIVDVAKTRDAYVLVDEAHSVLIAGPSGRGVCEEAGVLGEVDLLVITFSKAFGGVGGALIAKRSITQYVNWNARCRMFSCAIDPAVTGGVIKSLELASGPDGTQQRRRIRENADYFREKLRTQVNVGRSKSWIVPVIFGSEEIGVALNDFLQRRGLDGSLMQYPAVPQGEALVRLFVTSQHTRAQLDRAARIIVDAAREFSFLTQTPPASPADPAI